MMLTAFFAGLSPLSSFGVGFLAGGSALMVVTAVIIALDACALSGRCESAYREQYPEHYEER